MGFPYQGAPGGSGPYTAYGAPPGQPWLLSTSPLTGFVLTNFLTGESWSFDAQGRYATNTDAYGGMVQKPGDSSGTAEAVSTVESGMVHFAPGNMVTVRAMRIGNSRLTQLWKPLRPCLNCR